MTTPQPPFVPGTSFYQPEIFTRLSFKCHPMVSEIEEQSNAWVRRHLSFAFASEQRLERFLKTRCALFGCLIWPNTRDDELMLDLANLSQHLFAFDDAYGDRDGIGRDTSSARNVFKDFFAVMEGNTPRSGHPYATSFLELWIRIAMPMTTSQRARYRRAVQDWLTACLREVASRQQGVLFDFESYLEVRRESVWANPCFPIIEHSLGLELPEEVVASRELAELHRLVTDCMILINDLYSFPKEVMQGDYVNAVPILCLRDRLELQRAVDRVCEILHDTESQFLARREDLLAQHPGLHGLLSTYVIGLGHYMAGLPYWSRITARYHGPGHEWNGLTSGIVTLGEAGTSIRPGQP